MDENGSKRVTVTNTYKKVAEDEVAAELTITKQVEDTDGKALKVESTKTYTFTVSGTDVYGNTVNKDVDVTVEKGQSRGSKQVEDLTYGTYTVTEKAHASLTGYTWQSVSFDKNPVSMTDADSKTQTVTATNVYDRDLTSLTITKELREDSQYGLPEDAKTATYTFDIETSMTDVTGPYTTSVEGTTVTFTDGKATVTVTGESSITINDLPTGSYTVTEWDASMDTDHWSWSKSGDGDVELVKGTPKTVTVTNTYTRNTVNGVTLTKQVRSAEDKGSLPSGWDTKSYAITITGPDAVKGKTYGTVTFDAKGSYTANLKHGETLTINGLPTGSYTLTEDETAAAFDYWNLNVTGTGKVTVSQDSKTFTVTNTYTKVAEEDVTASLTIAKTLAGLTTDVNRNYTFTIGGTDVYGNAPAVTTVTIQGGESETVDLLYGDYTVTETGETAIEGYTYNGVTYTGLDADGHVVLDENTASATVTATNTYVRDRADLTVTKIFKNLTDAEVARLGSFQISVTGPSDFTAASLTLSGAGRDENAKDPTYTWTLPDVPVGNYSFSEARKDAKLPEYSLTVKNGQGGDIITASDDLFVQQATLAKDGMYAICFQNAYARQLGSLTLNKQVSADGPDSVYSATYTFHIQAENFLLKDVAGKTIDGVSFDNSGLAVVTIAASEGTGSRTISGLPTGNYTVTEQDASVEYWDWTKSGDGTAAVTNNQTTSMTVTNTYERTYIPEEPEDLLAQLTIRKLVEDVNGETVDADRSYTFRITGQDVYGDAPVVTEVTVKGGESKTVELIYGTYTVTEVTDTAADTDLVDYTWKNVTYTNNTDIAMLDADTASATATATNVYERNPVTVVVEKQWADSVRDAMQPVTIHLVGNGTVIRTFVLDGVTDDLEREPWTAVIEDAPATSGGEPIEYTVTEDSLGENWRAVIDDEEPVNGEDFRFSVYNYYTSGGGGGTDPEDPTDIPDENTPTTDLPEDPTDIPDEETPTTDLPDEDVPQADVPTTGDNLIAWVLAAAVSGVGLVWLAISGKKRKDEQGE